MVTQTLKMFALTACLYTPFWAFSQLKEFSAFVLDAYDYPIVNAHVLNLSTNESTNSDENGYFTIPAKPNDSLKITPEKKPSFYYQLHNDFKRLSREIIFINADDPNVKVFDEVEITSSRIKSVVTRKNANVIDYKIYKNGNVLSLTSLRNKYWLNLEVNNKVIKEYELPEKKYYEIFHDIFGNPFIINKDSAFQVALSEELINIDAISSEKFANFIRPLLYADDSCVVSGIFSNHNKAFRMIKKVKNDSSEKVIHSIIDFQGLKDANRYYNDIIRTYMQTVPEQYNIITNGIWTGNMDHLADGRELITMVQWYKNIISKELNIYTFPLGV